MTWESVEEETREDLGSVAARGSVSGGLGQGCGPPTLSRWGQSCGPPSLGEAGLWAPQSRWGQSCGPPV